MLDFEDLIFLFLIIIGILIIGSLITAPMIYAANLASRYSCQVTANQMQKNYDYSLTKGCLIKINDQWIPIESYKIYKEEKNA